jgi:2-C-methyl-D-erythritol 4-phosphate cytidylyltransferase/2-C-methyl-D-erythritol 2,4-cyclodiphosphate synthase
LKKYDAVIPAIKASDTIILNKQILPREKCMQIQTPQAFKLAKIKSLHDKNRNILISDDSTLFFQNNLPVKIIPGHISNKKITYDDDIDQNNFYGIGYDIHKMILGRKLIIGGVTIPSKFGPIGHSDGDSLLHALIDSFLGAAKKGDIGTLFPNSKKFLNIKSSVLLKILLNYYKKINFKSNQLILTLFCKVQIYQLTKKKLKTI